MGAASLYDVGLLCAMYGMLGGSLPAFSLARAAGRTAEELLSLVEPWLRAMLSSLAGTAAEIDSGSRGAARSPLAMQAAGFDNLLTASRDLGLSRRLLTPVGELLDEAVAAGYGSRATSRRCRRSWSPSPRTRPRVTRSSTHPPPATGVPRRRDVTHERQRHAALAVAHDRRFVTVDRRLARAAVRGAQDEHLVVL